MTLTGRLTLGFAALAVTVCGAIGGLAYVQTDRGLDTQMRSTLIDASNSLASNQLPDGLSDSGPDPDGDGAKATPGTGADPQATVPGGHGGHGRRSGMLLAQGLLPSGQVTEKGNQPARLPVTAADVATASDPTDNVFTFREVEVDGSRYLMLTRSLGHGTAAGAVQVARRLDESIAVLKQLAEGLIVVSLVVAAAAAVAGLFLARALTRRLVRLTGVAEEVSATGQLDVEVPTAGTDEVGRLGSAFDAMLTRLARSKDDQQRLVQNAGHELRTPLTSVRTNVSLLRRFEELSAQERAAIVEDLAGETRELTDLVNELVELATDRRAEEPEGTVDLGEAAATVAARATRRSGRQVDVRVQPAIGISLQELAHAPGRKATDDTAGGRVASGSGAVLVTGRPQALERAVSNLVDNAIKFDRAGQQPVEIVIIPRRHDVRIEVRDRGPGVPEEDLGRIFDRFHRATSVRSLPGSGLGLSIVEEIAASHGGTVFAAPRAGGGAVIGFTVAGERFQPGSYPG